jgi:putative hydrolase of the HAD superfamily
MGVMFKAADDVAELLVPFVQRTNPTTASCAIESAYLAASLGDISADAFWSGLGLDPGVEDVYLQEHSLVPGTMDFLLTARASGIPVWCLSNDVERWSLKLRGRFGIDEYLEGAIISSVVRARKPDGAIYTRLLESCGYAPGDLIFVDDRQKNVVAASRFGIRAIHFAGDFGYEELKKVAFEFAA